MTLNLSELFSSLKARLTGRSNGRTQELVKLPRLLGITGRRSGSSKDFQLLATDMGHDQIMFKGAVRFREGEKLEIEMALPGFETLKTNATVGWMIRSTTDFNGQLLLTPSETQRTALAEYTRRQKFAQG